MISRRVYRYCIFCRSSKERYSWWYPGEFIDIVYIVGLVKRDTADDIQESLGNMFNSNKSPSLDDFQVLHFTTLTFAFLTLKVSGK